MPDKTAIRVSDVSKDFILPHEKISSVKSLFTKGFRRNKSKETQHALKNISFEVREGEFFGIVGRNGSGKSTLLKILAGIYQPTSGSTETRGKLVPFIELGVGFNPELTGRENVYLNGAMLGFSQSEVRAMYGDIVSFAELERFMDQKLKNYSSGMQVRLAFSMAVRAEADILLIDEVLAVGDADFQRKCFDYFKRLKLEGKTVIFVSHDMNAVREFCDRAMLLEESKIVLIGQTSEVAERYTKLFNKSNPEVAKKDNTQGSRWGTGKVRISDVWAAATANSVDITMTIAVKADIADPVIGFRVRDAAGKEVTGTNTKVERQNPGSLSRGSTVSVAWSFKNVLSDGKYYIDPSVINPDGTTVHDWWNKAATLTVKKSRHLPYVMDPGFKFSLDDPLKK